MSFKVQLYYSRRKNFKSPIRTQVLKTNVAILILLCFDQTVSKEILPNMSKICLKSLLSYF